MKEQILIEALEQIKKEPTVRVFAIAATALHQYDIIKDIQMQYITVPKYIIEESQDALRLAANILESRKRLTAADRCIEYSERLLNWVLDGQVGKPPSVFP